MQPPAPSEPKPLECPTFYVTDAMLATTPHDVGLVFLARKTVDERSPAGYYSKAMVVPIVELHMGPEAFRAFARLAAEHAAKLDAPSEPPK